MNIRNLSFLTEDFFSSIDRVTNGIASLTFEIPDQIFLVLQSLTKVVGYVMPLRLYTPIINLVLAYWLLMITIRFMNGASNLIGNIASFFTTKMR